MSVAQSKPIRERFLIGLPVNTHQHFAHFATSTNTRPDRAYRRNLMTARSSGSSPRPGKGDD